VLSKRNFRGFFSSVFLFDSCALFLSLSLSVLLCDFFVFVFPWGGMFLEKEVYLFFLSVFVWIRMQIPTSQNKEKKEVSRSFGYTPFCCFFSFKKLFFLFFGQGFGTGGMLEMFTSLFLLFFVLFSQYLSF